MSAFTEAIMVEAHRATIPLGLAWLETHNHGEVLYRRFLYRLCKMAGVKVAIEIGIMEGITTLHLAAAVERAVIGVDIDITQGGIADNSQAWRTVCTSQVSLVKGDSTSEATVDEVARILLNYGGKADLLYIDSLHQAKQATREWELYRHLLTPGALVVMDDIKDPPEMYPVFKSIPGEHLEFDWLHEASRYRGGITTVGFGLIILD